MVEHDLAQEHVFKRDESFAALAIILLYRAFSTHIQVEIIKISYLARYVLEGLEEVRIRGRIIFILSVKDTRLEI